MRRKDAPPTVCLNMIVKDEAHVIERCLNDVKPLIDAWCIVDTGSTDGTQEIIRRVMADVPGALHERPWKNFGHNRTEAIQLAGGMADYILTIDADETLDRADGFDWSGLTGDALLIEKRRGTRRYRVINLVRDGLDWAWVGAVHEVLDSPHHIAVQPINGIAIRSPREGARARDPLTFRRDAVMLEAALLEDPNNTRNVFYLAQSYRDAEEYDLALRYYRQRATMGVWAEEVFCSLYQAARMMVMLGQPAPECVEAFLMAHEHTPRRAEPLFEVGMYYARRRQWASAWLFLERAAALPLPDDLILFVEADIYAWRALMEAAVAAYWIGEHGAAMTLNQRLLDSGTLPEQYRETVVRNLSLSADFMSEGERRVG